MVPDKNNHSLDQEVEQTFRTRNQEVERVFRKRSKTSFWTAITAAGAFLLSSLTGCFAKDVRAMNPDLYRAKAEAFENSLSGIAGTMGLYDSATKTYDAAKVRAEAERQLEPDPDPKSITGYKNLMGYTNVDQLFAARYALGKVIEQNDGYIEKNKSDLAKKAEVDKKKKENDELRKLRESYGAALAMYNEVGAADPGRPDSERIRCSLAIGLTEYGRNSKDGVRNWKSITKDRKDAWGRYDVGDDADLEFVAERYSEDVENAFSVRQQKKKRNGWAAFWTTVGTGLIYSLASQDDNGGSGSSVGGGEIPGPGGN